MTDEVWVVWPTVSLARSDLMAAKWQENGYKVAVLVNSPLDVDVDKCVCDSFIIQPNWSGFPTAVNLLCQSVPGDVVAVVGDDVYPDPDKTAAEIREEFLQTFPDTFGVMQPIGDIFASTHLCAVSPWSGRGVIERAYGGKGPFFPGYFHYFSDEELQEVATKWGVFHQRADLTQFHDHWQRKPSHKRPAHLMTALRRHKADKLVFQKRKKENFNGVVLTMGD